MSIGNRTMEGPFNTTSSKILNDPDRDDDPPHNTVTHLPASLPAPQIPPNPSLPQFDGNPRNSR